MFETEPQEALPDVWFENDQSYSIDSLCNHSGNVTNQDITAGVAGVVNTLLPKLNDLPVKESLIL